MAEANPATVPVGSAVGTSLTAQATPDVPIDTTTSPGRAPSPSAAAALSPAPGPSTCPVAACPAASDGASTRGSATSARPMPRSSRSGRYSPGDAREVAGAAGVGAVRDQVGQVARRRSEPAAQPPRQPVVRQAHRRRRRGVLLLVLGEPAQLGDGERGDGDAADGVGPLLGAQLRDEVRGRLGRARVVPQQRGPHDGSALVEAHHPVLLAADGDRGDVVEPPGGGERLIQGASPRPPGRPRCRRGAARAPAGPARPSRRPG